ncbi:MAG TPA: hypothetical protein DCP36_01275 [Sporomusaceae bacterium]|nr:hypothetical protein [Sporomusaceae bacterium]
MVILLNLFRVTVDIISNRDTDGVESMAITQSSLNSLLAALTPKNNMAVLREQRASLLQKLQQRTGDGGQQTGDMK